MSINVNALKGQVTDQLLINQPAIVSGYDLFTTAIYANPAQPGATLGVPDLGVGATETNPTNYTANANAVGNVDVVMKLVQAKRYLTFGQLQAGLSVENLTAGLVQDLAVGLNKEVLSSLVTGATAVSTATFKKIWATLKGKGKCIAFGESLLPELNADYNAYKMLEDLRMEPGFGGYKYAQYVDDLAAIIGTGKSCIGWSQGTVGLALAPVIPIGDANEATVAAINGLPGLYSRITVDEGTRKVTVTLEVMAGVGKAASGVVALGAIA